MYVRYTICKGAVRQPSNHLKCAICKNIIHNGCAYKNSSLFYCINCNRSIMPFQNIDDGELNNFFEMDIYELIDLLDRINWEERLSDTSEKIETVVITIWKTFVSCFVIHIQMIS